MPASDDNSLIVTCPVDPSHRVLRSRLQTHIEKCRNKSPKTDMDDLDIYLRSCSNDTIVTCPVNPSHQVFRSRIRTHVELCRYQNYGSDMVTCPFNDIHRFPRSDLATHLRSCSDRDIQLRAFNLS